MSHEEIERKLDEIELKNFEEVKYGKSPLYDVIKTMYVNNKIEELWWERFSKYEKETNKKN